MTIDKAELLQTLNEVLPDLLKPTVDTLLADVKTFMAESVSPLADRVEAIAQAPKEQSKEQPKEQSQDDPKDPLQARVKLLEQQLAQAAEKEAQAAKVAEDGRFSSTLNTELDKLSPLHKGVVQELLSTRLRKDAVEKDGEWLARDGKKLPEVIQEFFKSPEGMHFLPSSHTNGVGATESAAPKTGDKINMNDAIMAAFL